MDMGEIMDKSQYKEQLGKLLTENSQLKEKIKELETELYFKYRNEKVTEHSEKNVNKSVDNFYKNHQKMLISSWKIHIKINVLYNNFQSARNQIIKQKCWQKNLSNC